MKGQRPFNPTYKSNFMNNKIKQHIGAGWVILSLIFFSCQTPEGPVNYYFDPSRGNDRNPGTSPKLPFKGLKKIRELNLNPGDSILLKSGAIFYDSLYISCKGAPGKPVVVGKYGGKSRPHIRGDASALQAVHIFNSEYLVIRDLEISNKGKKIRPHLSGLLVELKNYGVARNILIDNLYIHDVYGSLIKGEGNPHKDAGGGQGIMIRNVQGNGPDSIASRFDRLVVQNCYLKDCQRNGIMMWGNWIRKYWYPSRHVVIRNNVIDGIPGDGIVPVGCEAPLVEYNVMKNCPPTLLETEACDGIWPWSCDNAVIQYNIVSDHQSKVDGYGFDSDYNCTNSLFQYNLSFHNDGGFFLLCNSGGWPAEWSAGNKGTIARYNVSINDGIRDEMQKGHYFSPVINCTGPVSNSVIEKNIFILIPAEKEQADRTLICFSDWEGYPDSTFFRDNYIFTKEKYRAVELGKSTRTVLSGNFYAGTLMGVPEGFEKYSGPFSQTMWYGRNDENWNKLIRFIRDKTVMINGTEMNVADLIGAETLKNQ